MISSLDFEFIRISTRFRKWYVYFLFRIWLKKLLIQLYYSIITFNLRWQLKHFAWVLWYIFNAMNQYTVFVENFSMKRMRPWQSVGALKRTNNHNMPTRLNSSAKPFLVRYFLITKCPNVFAANAVCETSTATKLRRKNEINLPTFLVCTLFYLCLMAVCMRVAKEQWHGV